jgi:hypothetical protein
MIVVKWIIVVIVLVQCACVVHVRTLVKRAAEAKAVYWQERRKAARVLFDRVRADMRWRAAVAAENR